MDDKQGNEIGHYTRMSLDGGVLQDVTPSLPLYSSFDFGISRSGNRIGFTAAYEDQFHIFCVEVEKDGTLGDLRKLYTSPRLLLGILLSYDGSVLTVMSSERTGKLQFSLLVFDILSGEKLSELWDGEENSMEMMVSSPLPDDPRLLATTTQSGIETLLIWDPRTGERTDLTFGNVTGAVRAFDWSADGKQILFRTFNSAIQQLYLHNLNSGETIPLRYPTGTIAQPYFTWNDEEIFSL